MAADGADKFSVLLPTYNERENLPLVVWLLARTFRERYRPRGCRGPGPGWGRCGSEGPGVPQRAGAELPSSLRPGRRSAGGREGGREPAGEECGPSPRLIRGTKSLRSVLPRPLESVGRWKRRGGFSLPAFAVLRPEPNAAVTLRACVAAACCEAVAAGDVKQ